MYIGDELKARNPVIHNKFVAEFGNDARHMIVEAFTGQGVIASPIRKYEDYNIRICRPFGILPKDLQTVIDDVIGNLGKNYDNQNIIDLGLLLLPPGFNPFKKHTIQACLGNCNDFQVICSGMIARSFQMVGYPIVPTLRSRNDNRTKRQKSPYGSKPLMRHYSQILPRDFDLSPNFEIIKFNIIESGRFDYKSMWLKDDF